MYDKYITKLSRIAILKMTDDRKLKTKDREQKREVEDTGDSLSGVASAKSERQPVLRSFSEEGKTDERKQNTAERDTGNRAVWAFWAREDQFRLVFLQNKANFHQAKINARPIPTKDYEKRCAFRVRQKQSQSNPIKANFRPAKTNASFFAKKGNNGKGNSCILEPDRDNACEGRHKKTQEKGSKDDRD